MLLIKIINYPTKQNHKSTHPIVQQTNQTMKGINWWVYTILGVVFMGEMLIVVRINSNLLLIIIALHILSFGFGYVLSKRYNWHDLALLDSILLKKEPLTEEFAVESLNLISAVFFMIPSLIIHLFGVSLLIPRIKLWVSHNLLPKVL